MFNTVRFSCTALVGSNKAGVIKKDSSGYYRLVLGALNVINSGGAYYPYEQAKHLFLESGQLMRRIKKGALRGEYGHPKRQPGQDLDSFANRIMSIHEEMVCCHIKEIILDFENYKGEDGKPIIAIVGLVCPSGPYGAALERSLDNPGENVCFSIRSFTADSIVGGRTEKVLQTIVTWDYVNEPGIAAANKYNAPGLESLEDQVITRGQLERGLNMSMGDISMESAHMSGQELFKNMCWTFDKSKLPAYANW